MNLKIIRSKRKTLRLSIDGDDTVIVQAPVSTGEDEIAAFVNRHRRWISNRLNERRAGESLKFDFTAGSELCLFGKRYVLSKGRARICGETLYLPEQGRETALKRILKQMTLDYMPGICEKTAREYGFCFSGVRVTSARTRWGTCNINKIISFSFRTAFLPVELTEYLCVHELCHTKHFNHSPEFWQSVEKILPDWKTRRKKLKELGAIMRIL